MKHQQRQQQQQEAETTNSIKKADMKQGQRPSTTEMQRDIPAPRGTTIENGIPQFEHDRIRALHGDHQPQYVAPPPPNFFPPFLPHSTTCPEGSLSAVSTTPLKAHPLVRSVSAAEPPTAPPSLGPQQLRSLISPDVRQPQCQPLQLQSATPVLATPSATNVLTVSTASPGVVPVVLATSTKGRRGRKPKDPVAHAAKREAKEKRRLEKEAAITDVQSQQQQIVFVAEEVVPVVTAKEASSRPSTSGGISQVEPSILPSSFSDAFEHKKRSAETAFSTDVTASWMGGDAMSIDIDSTWTMSTPLTSPIPSPETAGLGIFLQAPPSTPIDEILSSSAHLGINPALLLQDDYFPSSKLVEPIRALKSPLEIIDEYSFHAAQSPIPTSLSNRPSTASEESASNKKLGLMDLMLLRQTDSEDKPSPKKKPRPNLVFSTTKRGKAIVSLQKPSPEANDAPTAQIPDSGESEHDLRSLVLKRRQQVWGDEVGTEVTRIAVHRRLTSRKTSTGLMSPLSPKFSLKRSSSEADIVDSDSDSTDSSDSEDDSEDSPIHQIQVTPLATPTNPHLLSTATSQSMQKSFSAPGFFHSNNTHPTENIFLPSTPLPPSDDNDEYPHLLPPTLTTPTPLTDDSGMRCKTCGMLFRKLSVLAAHERTCMVKQTPFIPYDFLKADAHSDDGFVFSAGRTLFPEDVMLMPRNLGVQIMGFESGSSLDGERDGKFLTHGFVAPRDTVSSEDDEEERREGGWAMQEKTVKKRAVIGEPKGTTRCICNKHEKAVSGVMVQW